MKVFTDMCCNILETKQWLKEQMQSLVIPLLKKGNLRLCQNYHMMNLISHTSYAKFETEASHSDGRGTACREVGQILAIILLAFDSLTQGVVAHDVESLSHPITVHQFCELCSLECKALSYDRVFEGCPLSLALFSSYLKGITA